MATLQLTSKKYILRETKRKIGKAAYIYLSFILYPYTIDQDLLYSWRRRPVRRISSSYKRKKRKPVTIVVVCCHQGNNSVTNGFYLLGVKSTPPNNAMGNNRKHLE